MNHELAEVAKIVAGGAGLLNSGGLTGRLVSMARFRRVQIQVYLKPASGTDPAAITLTQRKSTDESPTSEKTLPFTKARRQRPGTSDDNEIISVSNNSITTSAAAAEELYTIDVDSDSLDVANGFDCVRANVSDPGSVSTPASITYIGYDAGYAAADPPSAVVA
jgi:hypothetical protein